MVDMVVDQWLLVWGIAENNFRHTGPVTVGRKLPVFACLVCSIRHYDHYFQTSKFMSASLQFTPFTFRLLMDDWKAAQPQLHVGLYSINEIQKILPKDFHSYFNFHFVASHTLGDMLGDY